MPRSPAAYRRLASRVLSERGIAAVWQLHLDALAAHLAGFPGAAALLLSIADAAEELVWFRAQVTEAPQRKWIAQAKSLGGVRIRWLPRGAQRGLRASPTLCRNDRLPWSCR